MTVETDVGQARAQNLLKLMRSRRVCRNYSNQVVSKEDIRTILQAARWASSAGNRRINKFLVIRNQTTIRLVKAVSPGILGRPPVLIVVCTDVEKAQQEQVQLEKDLNTWIDVGTAAMNMMLMAEALGLGTCPATSFSRSGVRITLDLPSHLIPEFILLLGYCVPGKRWHRPGASTRLGIEDFTYWERYNISNP